MGTLSICKNDKGRKVCKTWALEYFKRKLLYVSYYKKCIKFPTRNAAGTTFQTSKVFIRISLGQVKTTEETTKDRKLRDTLMSRCFLVLTALLPLH